MHELPVTENILRIALERAPQTTRITDLYLVIGQLSSIIDESVQFYWDIICEGTPAEKSRLHFRRVPAQMQCLQCQRQYGLGKGCPHCGSFEARVICGDEFYLEAIDVTDLD